jgi:hypothetical protein
MSALGQKRTFRSASRVSAKCQKRTDLKATLKRFRATERPLPECVPFNSHKHQPAIYSKVWGRTLLRIAPGFHEVQERAVKLANENADAAFKLAKDVAQAKDLQELIDLQTRYVQSQMKWYAYQ